MHSLRFRVLSFVGLGTFIPLTAFAQEDQIDRVDFTTPRSRVVEYAHRARTREFEQNMLKVFYATMGAHISMPKRTWMKADYYDAWLARLQDRSFPDETIPENQFLRAIERRQQMPGPPRSLTGPANPSGMQKLAIQPKWEPVGPTRTAVPYVTYYGPANSYVSGRVGGIAFHPTNAQIIYMTGAAGGVFKTVNGGTNWTPLTSGFTAPYAGPIAISPTNANLIIVGAGDFDGGVGVGNGFYRSTDGGVTWTGIAQNQITNVAFSNIIFDASTPGRILASAGRRGAAANGLWESLDNGLTWAKRVVAGSTTTGLTTLSAGPTAPNGDRPMIATREYPAAVLSSRDAGRTWTVVTSYPGNGVGAYNVGTASAVDPNVCYAINDNQQKAYKGVRAAGAETWTWTDITGNFPAGYNWSQSFYDFHMHAAKHTVNGVARDTVYVGLITIAAWDGNTWTDFGATYTGGAKTHNDQHTFAFFPADPTKMAIGNDGGIYGVTIAANGAHTIDARVNGDATMAMFYSGAFHPNDPTLMFGGTQDNASPVSIGDLGNWKNRTGGDGTGSAIDPVNPGRQYGASQFLGMSRTTNAWNTELGDIGRNWNDPAGVPFVGRFSTDTSPQGFLYAGGNSWLYRYNPLNNSWTDHLGNQDFVGAIRSIAAAPSNPQVLYVGTDQGRLYMSSDRGTTWRVLDGTGTLGVISSLSVHPTKPFDLIFSTSPSNPNPFNVFRYADTSAATPVRTAVAGSGNGALPRIFAASVCRNLKAADTTWYVSTDVGVFGTTNSGGSWFNMTEPLGLPPVEGSTIQHTLGTGYLNLATYGRGMWRLKIDDVKTPAALKVTGSIRRTAYNVVALDIVVTNTGGFDATVSKVTGANAFIGQRGYAPFTALPVSLGTIAPGASKSATLTYRDNALVKGATGTVTVQIEWKSEAQNLKLATPIDVVLP